MLCQAPSVLLLIISTLKIVIGQRHGYYLAISLYVLILQFVGSEKLVFSIWTDRGVVALFIADYTS